MLTTLVVRPLSQQQIETVNRILATFEDFKGNRPNPQFPKISVSGEGLDFGTCTLMDISEFVFWLDDTLCLPNATPEMRKAALTLKEKIRESINHFVFYRG